MARTRSGTGKAISPGRRTAAARAKLIEFVTDAERRGDLDEWRRGRAILGYIEGRSVIEMARDLGKARGSLNRWLRCYEANGVQGLRTGTAPGPMPKLTAEQQANLVRIIEDGPQQAGYQTGVWTGPMIADLIAERFGHRYHNHAVPRLLNQLGFSLQRPRKRLARADAEAQAQWLRARFPAIKKKRRPVAGS
jgi:transposase